MTIVHVIPLLSILQVSCMSCGLLQLSREAALVSTIYSNRRNRRNVFRCSFLNQVLNFNTKRLDSFGFLFNPHLTHCKLLEADKRFLF